jgi:hypothetical protein
MSPDYEIKEVSAGDVSRYDAFLASSPQGTTFAGGRWLGLLGRTLPGRVFALAFEAGTEPRALVPIWETRDAVLGAVAEIPPLTPYWGPCLPPPGDLRSGRVKSRDHDVLAAVAAEFKRRWRYGRMAAHPTLADVRPFTWAAFRADVGYTSILVPTPEEDFLSGLPSSLRNKIKQGGVTPVEESADAGPFAEMYGATFGRRGMRPPVTAAFLEALAAEFCGAGASIFYLPGEDGAPVAGRLVLWDEGAAYDLLAASFDAGRGPRGAYLLWREILAAWARGLPLDMVGVNVESIARFKESFGGELTPYHRLAYYRSPFVRLAAGARRRLRG